jgi:hypothetical protein
MPETMSVDGVDLVLAQADGHDAVWLDYNDYVLGYFERSHLSACQIPGGAYWWRT